MSKRKASDVDDGGKRHKYSDLLLTIKSISWNYQIGSYKVCVCVCVFVCVCVCVGGGVKDEGSRIHAGNYIF